MFIISFTSLLPTTQEVDCHIPIVTVSDDPLLLGEDVLREADVMDKLAERAMECFKTIEREHGVWDIFLQHYLQVSHVCRCG